MDRETGGFEILGDNGGDADDCHQYHEDFDVNVTFLDLSRASMELKLKENQSLARAMETGKLKNLEILMLEENHGDFGMRSMLTALSRHHLKGLRKIFLWEVSSYDQTTFGEEGTETIADALAEGALPNLEVMDLRGSLRKLRPSRTCFEALISIFTKYSSGDGRSKQSSQIFLGCVLFNICPGTIQQLECLRCVVGNPHVYSGDTGIRKIATALRKCPMKNLKELFLQGNDISDKGASELAKTLRRGLLPSLERLDLQNNPVGMEGAESIIYAFLRNPLLTATVEMEWPNLQRRRYVAFRESNLRLEWRLKDPDLDIESSQIAINNFVYPEYVLRRPEVQFGKQLKPQPHRLRILCQAHARNREIFEDHNVMITKDEEVVDPDGIEFRVLSMCNPSPPSYVDREPESIQDLVSYSKSDLITADHSEELGLEGKYVVSGPLSSKTSSLKRKGEDTPLKRTKGVNRIYIKKRSFGFIASAKAFGSQEGRPPPKSLIGRVRWSGLVTYHEKTREDMKAVVQELLMLADRKPLEFFAMFGLRQVMLKNPKKPGLYSRCWICHSCFVKYQSGDQHSVFPITTNLEIGIPQTEYTL